MTISHFLKNTEISKVMKIATSFLLKRHDEAIFGMTVIFSRSFGVQAFIHLFFSKFSGSTGIDLTVIYHTECTLGLIYLSVV